MATNKLTDTLCKKAAPRDKPYKLTDGDRMYLYVTPKGAKVWRLAYNLNGKEQVEVLGPYPLISLAEARVKRDDFRRRLLAGEDVKAAPPAESASFRAVWEEYWEKRKDITDRYRGNALRGLEMHLGKELGDVPITRVTKDRLLKALLVLDAEGKHSYSRKVRVWAHMVFEWAVATDKCENNPANAINPKTAFGHVRVKHHAAIRLDEVGQLFHRLSFERELQSVLATRMLAMTWVRTGELRMMKWEEVEGDVWRIRAERMKMRREHLVPLPRQALELLEKLKARSRGSVYVFPSDRRLDRPMSENSILYLLARVGYGGRMTGHGFRTVGSTWANEREYNKDHIEMQLAHANGDAVRGAYNQAQYISQRRVMLQDFADWLDAEVTRASSKGSGQVDAGSPQG